MDIWIKHRRVSANEEVWDYDYVDIYKLCEEYAEGEPREDLDTKNKAILAWLRDRAAMLDGDRYFGSEHQFQVVPKPPEEWFVQEWRRALNRRVEAQQREQAAAQALHHWYPPRS